MIWKTQQGLLGIDFGTNAVKIAQTKKVNGFIYLQDATCAITNRLAPLEMSIDQLPEMHWRAFRFACHSSEEFQRASAACLLPKSCASLQFLQVADDQPADQRRTIESYLSSNVPGSSGLTWDFWSWSNNADARNEENAGVVLTSRSLVEATESTLRSSGINCHAMDGVPTALSRAVGMQSHRAGPVIALDWGVSEALLTIVVDDAPVFARNLRGCGLGDAISQCSQTLCLSEKEIAAVWHDSVLAGLSDSQQVEIRNAVTEFFTPVLHAVIDELQRTKEYLGSHRQSWSPVEIMLFGLGSLIPNVARNIGAGTELATSIWSPDSIIDSRSEASVPISLLAPAIATSALTWESA